MGARWHMTLQSPRDLMKPPAVVQTTGQQLLAMVAAAERERAASPSGGLAWRVVGVVGDGWGCRRKVGGWRWGCRRWVGGRAGGRLALALWPHCKMPLTTTAAAAAAAATFDPALPAAPPSPTPHLPTPT